jgi:excisionase family DNA binding protein
MAQQYYTLEEAAQKLGMSADALREMAKKKEIRAFQDRGNWRFRASDIEEEARRRGADSEPELALGEAKKTKTSSDSDVRLVLDDNISLASDSDVRLDEPKSRNRSADSGVRLDRGSDSDVKLVEESKSPSDSDIRLQDSARGNPGSSANIITEEIDLDAEEAKAKAKQSKGGKPRAQTQYNPNMPVLPTNSPYEISEPDLDLNKKRPNTTKDGSSEHEMIAFDPDKARDELGSGEIPLLAGDEEVDFDGVPAPNAGNSGINLQDAVDSGISLEDGGSDELEFELSLDAESTPKPAPKTPPKGSKKAAAPLKEEDSSSEFELSLDEDSSVDPSSSSEFELSLDSGPDLSLDSGSDMSLENSDSEFELTLDEEGALTDDSGEGKDIFEETNLDLQSLDVDDSASEVVSLDQDTDLEESEFDIDLEQVDSDTGSQVISLDEEEADDAAATVAQKRTPAASKAKGAKAKAAADDEDLDMDFGEMDVDAQPKKKPAKKKAATAVVDDDEDDLYDEDDLDDEDDLRSSAAPAPAADWGPVPAIFLFPTFIVLFMVGIMCFELIQGMWGYHRSTKVGKPIIDNIARLFDDKIPKD